MSSLSSRQYEIRNLQDLQNLTVELLLQMPPRTIVLLSGEMGVGKTEFVKQLAKALRYQSDVASPTFALHHHYRGQREIEHWDLYRLVTDADVDSSGFWESLNQASDLFIIEWPERIRRKELPLDRCLMEIRIQRQDPSEARQIEVQITRPA